MKRHRFLLIPLAAALFVAACDTLDTTDTFSQEYVVESYQIALQELQPVLITQTAPLEGTWNFEDLAVSDATVRVNLLAEDGSVEASFSFTEWDEIPGVYLPDDETHRILPLRTYALDVSFPNNDDRITATTVVPDTFQLVTTNADTLIYQGTEQLEITVTRSFFPGRQNVFIFVSEALDPRIETLTPFIAAIFEEDEDSVEDFATGSSPILNEANYDVNLDGTLTIQLPWIAINFYGPNRLIANAIDDNLLDFFRSQFVQENGSTLSPGEIPDVLTNIEGARGIFGSLARSIAEAYIEEPAN